MESLAVNKAKDELEKEPWKFWEAENYKNSTESGLLILPDGTTKDFDGIEHHVVGKEEDIKLMDGAIFTHNHPTDNTFSQDTSTLRKETSQAKSNPINNYITKEIAISREFS